MTDVESFYLKRNVHGSTLRACLVFRAISHHAGCSLIPSLVLNSPPPEPGRSRWAEHTLLMGERLAAFTTVSTSTQQRQQRRCLWEYELFNTLTLSLSQPLSSVLEPWNPPHSNPPLRHGSPQAHLRAILLPAGRKSDLEREPPKLRMVAGVRYESTLPQTRA